MKIDFKDNVEFAEWLADIVYKEMDGDRVYIENGAYGRTEIIIHFDDKTVKLNVSVE